MNPAPRSRPADLLIVGIPSIGLIVLAIVLGAQAENVLFARVLYTVRVTMVLFTVSLGLYILPGMTEQRGRYWLAFSLFAFLSYVVHVYYSFFLFFHGSVSEFYMTQGAVVATINVIITVWWTADIVLAWVSTSGEHWIVVERDWIHGVIFGTFFVSTVLLHAVDNKQPFVIVLGVIMGIVALVCFVIRIRAHQPPAAGT